jgi:Transthyretin-like family
MATWRSTAACLATVLAAPTLASADATVKAVGSVFCRAVPLERARVELMDSDCHGGEACDDVLKTARVDAQGNFEVSGRGGDGSGPGGDPDVYIRIAFNDDMGVRMTDEANVTRSVSTPQHDHDNTPEGTTIDFGRITVGGSAGAGDTPRCAIFLAPTASGRPSGHPGVERDLGGDAVDEHRHGTLADQLLCERGAPRVRPLDPPRGRRLAQPLRCRRHGVPLRAQSRQRLQ